MQYIEVVLTNCYSFFQWDTKVLYFVSLWTGF